MQRPGGKLIFRAVGNSGREDLPLKGLLALLREPCKYNEATMAARNKEAKAAKAKMEAKKAAAEALHGGAAEKAAAVRADNAKTAAEKEAGDAKAMANAIAILAGDTALTEEKLQNFKEEVKGGEPKGASKGYGAWDHGKDGGKGRSDPYTKSEKDTPSVAKAAATSGTSTADGESETTATDIIFDEEAGANSLHYIQTRLPILHRELEEDNGAIDGLKSAGQMLVPLTGYVHQKAGDKPGEAPDESSLETVKNARAVAGLDAAVEASTWTQLDSQLEETKVQLKKRLKELMQKVESKADMIKVMEATVKTSERLGTVEANNDAIKNLCLFVFTRLAEDAGKHSKLKKLAGQFRVRVGPDDIAAALELITST